MCFQSQSSLRFPSVDRTHLLTSSWLLCNECKSSSFHSQGLVSSWSVPWRAFKCLVWMNRAGTESIMAQWRGLTQRWSWKMERAVKESGCVLKSPECMSVIIIYIIRMSSFCSLSETTDWHVGFGNSVISECVYMCLWERRRDGFFFF